MGSNESLAFIAMELDPKIDTGDRAWPKCDQAILNIKVTTREEGERIVYSLFDIGEKADNVPIIVHQVNLGQIRGYLDSVWIQRKVQDKLAQGKENERVEAIEKEKAVKLQAKLELETNQAKMRKEEQDKKVQAEIQWQAAQAKMRQEDEEERIREQRKADLRSGKMKISNIEDAKLAFDPSSDNHYTIGVPIDGFANIGQYYIWDGTLSWKSDKTYFCLDSNFNEIRCFGFSNIITRFTEMRENSRITVVGKLAGETEVILTNKLSGYKENKRVPLLTDCYIF